jgi:hypothetical protein
LLPGIVHLSFGGFLLVSFVVIGVLFERKAKKVEKRNS